MGAAAEIDQGRAPLWRRAAASLWPSLAGKAPRSMTSGFISGAVVAAGAAPFSGWLTPGLWFVANSALVVGSHVYSASLRRRGRDPFSAFNPFTWLISVTYSAAALYFVWFFDGAAQTLGVTLYGVVMFQILARDYAVPRRLIASLAAPILSMALVQVYASLLLIQHAQPWKIVTLLVCPIVVFRAFRAVQVNLRAARKEAREALKQLSESEARYRLLAERSPDIIIRYDTAGIIEYISPAAANYGYEPASLVGRDLAYLLEPEERERNAAFLADLAAGREVPSGADNVWRTVGADGAALAFEGARTVLHDDRDRVVGAIAALRDVTLRVALEDELRARRAEAEAANEAKSQFLANMSHEIRTPLTGVVGFARILQGMTDLPGDARAHVSRIAKSGEALLGVVNDILDFSKLEAGQMELDPQPFDVVAFFDETIDLVRPRAADKGLSVALELSPDLPLFLSADAARLRQVLLNLLTNAVKFTFAGGVTVSAGYENDRICVAVADSGPGIAPQAAQRLFQRFSQVDDSNTRVHGGSGLGLAICKGLVEMMRGEIGLRSAPDQGSTFWFTVPAAAASSATPTLACADVGDGPPEFEARSLTILVVDDVAVNRELICTMLAPFDIAVTTAAGGAEAVEAACAQPFDLILMDLQMPGMDGMAATKAIRANSEVNRATPILAISANVLSSQVEAARLAGMDDHIAKPINPTELLTKIGEWGSGAREPAPDNDAVVTPAAAAARRS
ncbi:MAG TPA: ATP-binding protein [Caulobacteraceae bacterium]|nr:ATP-binding protein [Caulobacteraceae bacterium]